MKKTLLLLLITFSLSTFAQYGNGALLPLIKGDTVVNTASVSKIITATGGYSTVALQLVIAKISGTVAGTAILYGSIDGVNYKSLGDTLTLANQTTNSTVFVVNTTPYVYYKIVTTGVGTMSAQIRLYYILRKYITN